MIFKTTQRGCSVVDRGASWTALERRLLEGSIRMPVGGRRALDDRSPGDPDWADYLAALAFGARPSPRRRLPKVVRHRPPRHRPRPIAGLKATRLIVDEATAPPYDIVVMAPGPRQYGKTADPIRFAEVIPMVNLIRGPHRHRGMERRLKRLGRRR